MPIRLRFLLVANVWPRLTLAVCFIFFLSFVGAASGFADSARAFPRGPVAGAVTSVLYVPLLPLIWLASLPLWHCRQSLSGVAVVSFVRVTSAVTRTS